MPIKRGQFITSYRKLVKELPKCSEQKLRTFLKLLEKDKIICIYSLKKATQITICNYDSYQGKQHNSNTTATQQQHSSNDNRKKENKENKENKEIIYSLYPSKCPIKNSSTGKSRKANLAQIEKLLKEHSKEHIEKVINYYISNCKESNTYIKNFSTFLNNLPDIEEKKEARKQKMIQYNLFGQIPKYCKLEEWPQIQKVYTIQIQSYKEVLR